MFFKSLTRGGQTQIHQFRMIKQVLLTGLFSSFLLSSVYQVKKVHDVIPTPVWKVVWSYYHAQARLLVPLGDERSIQVLYYPINDGRPYNRRAIDIVRHHQTIMAVQTLKKYLLRRADPFLYHAVLIFISIMMLWSLMGVVSRRKKYLRGSRIVSSTKLVWMIKKARKASWLRIDKLPLIKDKETTHILLTGTTGSGKTNCLHKLLPKIQGRGQKAIVIDLNGSFVSKYYREGKDIILNPFDERNHKWNPWADCLIESHYEAFAKAMIPGANFSGDKFWDSAAQTVLSAALEKQAEQNDKKIASLCQILMGESLKDLSKYFEGTHAANLVNQDSDKTTGSIMATLSTQIKALRYLEDTDKPFSIRDYIKDDDKDGWIFLTAKPDQRQTLTPLITAWFEIALNGLMSLEPDYNRRLWFIIDELPALQKVPSLDTALSEARKYGGCVLAGIQNIAQLTTIYGHHTAKTLLDNFATKIFFKSTDPDTAHWISRVLGSSEEEETNENLSYGANTMRDGVNLSHQRRKNSLVMDDEIMNLKDLEAYIKLPESFPITKMKTKFENPESTVVAFKDYAPKIHKFVVKEVREDFNEEIKQVVNNTKSKKKKKKKVMHNKVSAKNKKRNYFD